MNNPKIVETNRFGVKRRLLIEGWRGINHSIAMVNQHQILALLRAGEMDVYHRDLPFYMPHWNPKDNGAGFKDEDAQRIAALNDLADEDADFCFRISAPVPAPRVSRAKTLTYIVTEFGLEKSSFIAPAIAMDAYNSGEDLVVTPSRWSRDRILDFGMNEAGVRVVPHGVDHSVFFPLEQEERTVLRKNLGIDKDVIVFLNVGAPIWNKGIDLLLMAFAQVHQKTPRTRLIIKDGSQLYGIGFQSILSKFAQDHPSLVSQSLIESISVVSGNITQGQLAQLYGVCDCYVTPYRAEGFNLPALEALACGRPLIVSSGGATDDFCHGAAVSRIPSAFRRGPLGGYSAACWVEPYVPALVELMGEAVARGPIYPNLQTAAVEQSQSYSWDRVTNSLVGLYDVIF
jgi:glycosyltransferase involved in cell wall biosynthesis